MRASIGVFILCVAAYTGFGQASGDFRSFQSGDWNNVNTWERFNGSSWINPAPSTPTNGTAGVVTIHSPHVVTVTANVDIDQTTINSGGTLTINTGVTLTLRNGSGNDLAVNGTLIVNGTFTIQSVSGITCTTSGTIENSGIINNSNPQRLTFSSNSTYRHQFTTTNGNVPLATWDVNSTCEISSYTTNDSPPGNLDQTFGNFTWNTPSLAQDIDLASGLGGVAGNLTITVPTGITLIMGVDSFYELTVEGDFSVSGSGTVTFPGTLHLLGDLLTNGTLSFDQDAILSFEGSSAQSISGSTDISVNTIQVSNSSGVSVNGTVLLDGTLTLLDASAVFDADGSGSGVFVVRSTGVSSGGRIAELPTPANFTGNVTIQRFINGPDDWRYLAFPLASGMVDQWQDDFPVTGDFTDPSPNNVDGVVDQTEPSIYSYNASSQSWVAVGSGGATGSTALSGTTGYSVYTYHTGNFTISVTGSINKGDVSIPLGTASEGWNLIPNPMPSPIDWDNIVPSLPLNLNDAIYLRTANNIFSSYVGGVATSAPFGGWTGEVAIGQSFWVQSTGATSLTVSESAKTSEAYQFLRAEQPTDYFRVTLQSSAQKDDAVIRFHADATKNMDARFDAVKWRNGCTTCVNISSFNTATDPLKDFAINTVPVIGNCTDTVWLRIRDVKPGQHSITFTELDKLLLPYSIKLVDKFTGNEMLIKEGSVYTFQVTSDVNSYGASRFRLDLKSAVDKELSLAFEDPKLCDDQSVKLHLKNAPSGVRFQLMSGENAISDLVSAPTGGDITFDVSRQALQTGNNVLNVHAVTADGCDNHTFSEAYTYYFDDPSPALETTGGLHCGEGEVTLQAQGAPANGYYKWYEGDVSEPLQSGVEGSYTTPSLSKTKEYFVSVVNASGCESEKTKVEATIVYIDKPVIDVQGNILHSSSLTGNQWYKDDVLLEGETGNTLMVNESGSYTVAVSSPEGCTETSDYTIFTVAGEAGAGNIGITVFPNPVTTHLRVSFPQDVAKTIQKLAVYDGRGVEVASVQEKTVVSSGEVNLDFTEKRPGQYILNVVSEGKVIALRLVKK